LDVRRSAFDVCRDFFRHAHPFRYPPSGVLHIGNYFGMMRPAIALQAEGEAFYFIADYHALTSLQNPKALRENSRRVALDFLACGLDPERASLFRQSDVPQVAELAWILSTVTPMGLLERCHSYKDKTARGLAASAGSSPIRSSWRRIF
jgi:tryptophanyl-tRNA synthetase